MTITTGHTDDTMHFVGDFVQRAGKTFLVLWCGGEPTNCPAPDDRAEFFATQARRVRTADATRKRCDDPD